MVFLYKIGEASLGRMSIVNHKEMGMTKGQKANNTKGLGWKTTVGATLLGGVRARRAGTKKTKARAGGVKAPTN
jgi:hypothetical protein